MGSGTTAHLVNVFGVDEPGLRWPPVDLSKERLGGKGYGLAQMANAGLPVPPGFTLSTEACAQFQVDGWTDELAVAVDAELKALEKSTGRRLGHGRAPLLVSVRSGAAESMPGMMDTVLNVGMTTVAERALAEVSGDAIFAADTHRRFLLSYSEVVGGLDHDAARVLAGDSADATPGALRDVLATSGIDVPDDPRTQILESVRAVFRSWESPRARIYREREGIDDALGTAATVQMMVFGNLGDDSGTGVAFTRCPSTGEPGLIGDFLVRAQGEDVVAGTHETLPLDKMRAYWPALYQQLAQIGQTLERTYADMMDIEFTIERGELWILQTRTGKRSPEAVFRTAVDMAEDPDFPVDRATAVERCRPLLDSPPRSHTPPDEARGDVDVLATGIAASSGRAAGVLCTDIDDAVSRGDAGQPVVLARQETSPDDVGGMVASVGLVTALGGMVSHAAVVARAWGLPAVVGVDELEIDETGIRCSGRVVLVGETVTVDGTAGRLLLGRHADCDEIHPDVETIRRWAEELDFPRVTWVEPPSHTSHDDDMDVVERVLVLKGMATVDALDDVIGRTAQPVLEALAGRGRVEATGPMWRPMPETRRNHETADAKVAERHGDEFASILDRFHTPNLAYKELVTSWQLRTVNGEAVPNDHTDVGYDNRLLVQLRSDVHPAVTEVLRDAIRVVPRLGSYQRRLDNALARLDDGDERYVAHPMLDSYHTVWFELHEELLRLAGRNRAEEAAAGRA